MMDRAERVHNRMDYQPELAIRPEPTLTRVSELHEDAKRTARRASRTAAIRGHSRVLRGE